MTSSADFGDLKGDLFKGIICPPSFVVMALIFSELRGGGRIRLPPPQVPEDPKNPGLNRVKETTRHEAQTNLESPTRQFLAPHGTLVQNPTH